MFMLHEMTNFEQDSEMLEMNMANITNELSELIVGTGRASTPAMDDWMQPNENDKGVHDTMMDDANFATPGHRLIVPIQEHAYFSNIEDLRNSYESFCRNKLGNGIQSSQFEAKTSSRMIDAGKPRANSIDVSAFGSNLMPRHFMTGTRNKRRASAADIDLHEALICSAANEERTPDSLYSCTQTKRYSSNGARRKFSRNERNTPIDYDSVVIDLKAIGLNIENRETNDVLRLFAVFRKLHYYLNDVVPKHAEPDLTDYPKQFVKLVNPMPCTMNVQSQIKQAIYKSNAFCYRQFEKLDEFKMVGHVKYIECSRLMYVLRKTIKQLEAFKKIEFEHKQGIFVNSFGAAQAKNLEILLLQIIGKIRECNINVEVYLWSVKKNLETDDLPSLETLKKAVAIAGAILKDSPTMPLEKKDDTETTEEFKTVQEIPDINHLNRNEGGNGGGLSRIAVIPAPLFDARGMRYIGI